MRMMESTRKVTIYQVAEAANVSIGTVSKALANKDGISEATRQRVMEAARELGYVPNLAARSLMGGETGIVGLVVPYSAVQLFEDPHLLRNMLGIEEALNERDYNLLLVTARQENDPLSSYERLFRSRYFDGIVVMETAESGRLALHQRLNEQQAPWVVLGYPAAITPCYSVYSDDFMGGRQVANHLLALNHRHVALISADPRPSAFDERLRGFFEVMRQHGIRREQHTIEMGNMTRTSGYEAAARLFARPTPATAVFALNDRMALGVLDWLHENDRRVPDDIAVVGFDDIADSRTCSPSLTTVRQPAANMGREAVNLLFRLLAGETPPSRVVMATELLVRESTTGGR